GGRQLQAMESRASALLERNEELLVDAADARAAADDLARAVALRGRRRRRSACWALQLRQEFAVLPILADEDDDVVALLRKHESQDVGDARDENLKGLAVRSLNPHLKTPPHGAGPPCLPFTTQVLTVSRA